MGRVRSRKRRVRDDHFIVGCGRIVVGCGRIIVESSFYWRKHSGSYRWNLDLPDFVAGALFGEVAGWLYLLHALEMTFHMWRRSGMTLILRGRRSIWWCWRVTLLAPRIGNDVFICDADQWWHSFCVAGALFGDVGGWFYLLHALEMTFHMWRRSVMTFILRGRRSSWWCWRVTLLARCIGSDVLYVTQISDDIHFAWQA